MNYLKLVNICFVRYDSNDPFEGQDTPDDAEDESDQLSNPVDSIQELVLKFKYSFNYKSSVF
jgi:hypothetical protein